MPCERFTNEHVAFALRQAEIGATVDDVCRKMGVPEIWRMKQLEDENSKLKRPVADLTLDRSMLQDVLEQKW